MADIAELGYRVDSSELKAATSALEQNASSAKKAASASKKLEQEYAKISGGLQRDIALLGKTGKAAALRYDLENGALKNLAPARKANLLALAQEHDRTEKLLKTAHQFGLAIGTTLVAGLAASSAALKMSINRMDELSKSAQRVGLPTEELSKLEYAASLADVSIETFTHGLGLLTKSQAAALKETSKQARVFDALDISIKNADGTLRSSGDVLSDFADRFKAMKGSPEAMAAGFALFGRSFQQLIPLLKDGGDGIRAAGEELEAFGGVLSTEAGQNAEEFNDNLTRLETAAKSLGIAVAADLLPDLVELSDQWVDMAKDGNTLSETASEIADAIRLAGDVAKFVWGYFDALGDVAAGAAMGFVGLAEAAKGVINLDWDQIKRGIEVANQGADLAYFGEEGASTRNPGAYSNTPASMDTSRSTGGRRGRSVTIRETSQDEVDAYTRKLQKALAGPAKKGRSGKSQAEKDAEKLAKAIRQMADAQRDWQTELDGTGNAVVDAYAGRLDEITEKAERFKEAGIPTDKIAAFRAEMTQLAEALKAKELSEFQKDFAEDTAEIGLAIDGRTSPALVRYQKEVRELDRVLKSGAITQDDYNKRLLALGDERNSQAINLRADIEFETELLGETAEAQERLTLARQLGADAATEQGQTAIRALIDLQKMREVMSDQIGLMDEIRTSSKDLFVDIANGVKPINALEDAWERVHQKILGMIAENLMDQLFGKQGDPGGGSAGGWLSNIFGSMFGNSAGASQGGNSAGGGMDWGAIIGSFFGGGRANGGDVRAGEFYRTGEGNKPELLNLGSGKQYLIPGDNGRVVPTSGNQGITVQQTFVSQGRIDPNSAQQMQLEAAVKLRVATARNS